MFIEIYILVVLQYHNITEPKSYYIFTKYHNGADYFSVGYGYHIFPDSPDLSVGNLVLVVTVNMDDVTD